MKRLLSVVAILALAASLLLPVVAQAAFRGSFAPISAGDFLIRGKFEPALRHGISTGSGTQLSPKRERWLSFVTPSTVVGSESVGEIWIYRNTDNAGNPSIGLDPVPMLRDPTGVVSYIDPNWSRDGKWLAYVQTDNNVTQSNIYVQQFNTSTSSGTGPTFGNQPLGSPILIADGTGGIHHRHPAFNTVGAPSPLAPYTVQIAYDSDAFGPSIDLWTVNVTLDAALHTGTVDESSRTRHQLGFDDPAGQTILNSKAEFKPAYSPDNTKLAYVSNRLGVFQIYIVTLTANGLGETNVGAEATPILATKDNPNWSSDGGSLFYDCPSDENPVNTQNIWKLNLATGQKCPMFVDLTACVAPSVSIYTNVTGDGTTFNEFVFITQAQGFGVQIWRGNPAYNCFAPLPSQVVVTPFLVDIKAPVGSNDVYDVAVSYPPSVRTQGFVARAINFGGEGIRFRQNYQILKSPTIMGGTISSFPNDTTFDCTNEVSEIFGCPEDLGGCGFGAPVTCADAGTDNFLGAGTNSLYGWWHIVYDTVGTNHVVHLQMRRRTINSRIVALNLVNKYVPITERHYTNISGRQFLGFGYVQLVASNLLAGSIVMRQNYPNPFNPATHVRWAQDKPGRVDVRVFNVRGELVKTIADTWYPRGEHVVSWNGETVRGGHAASGVYYIRARANGASDVIKAVLTK